MIVGGVRLFYDRDRILLSRLLAATSEQLDNLPQPLFHYIAIGLTVAGMMAIVASILGFWAFCLTSTISYCCMSIYFVMVVGLLVAESMICLAISLWPHCLGISLDEDRMVQALQTNYGVPSREQYTIAMDLAQTQFGCCGMNDETDYEMSIWRQHSLGQEDWLVPLTCCRSEQIIYPIDSQLHLDPKPANENLCQSSEKSDYKNYRYTTSCLHFLDYWYRQQYVVFLIISLVLAVVEFAVLLCVIWNCAKARSSSTSISSQQIDDADNFINNLEMNKFFELQQHTSQIADKNPRHHHHHHNHQHNNTQSTLENIYEPDIEHRLDTRSQSSNTNVNGDDMKNTFMQPHELLKRRFPPITFKANSMQSYQTSTTSGFLV